MLDGDAMLEAFLREFLGEIQLKFENKKAAGKVDLEKARKQIEDLNETLREAGIEVLELEPEENTPLHNLYLDDTAVIINGIALICRPKKKHSRTAEVQSYLRDIVWQIVETPEKEGKQEVFLEGSDVVFTGKEIFVGIRKHGTNMEGGVVVARTWPDLPVIPIQLAKDSPPLKHFVAVAASGVLSMGKSKEATAVRQRIERESTFRYKVLSIDADEHINCINANHHLIFRNENADNSKYRLLQAPTELWGLAVDELVKLGAPFSRFCLLARRISSLKQID
uniref:Dimethylargininase n=1 Tax=Bursaphelenchus xylophilus TaxID=6326 RepID=A0A1I7RWK3_BURXY